MIASEKYLEEMEPKQGTSLLPLYYPSALLMTRDMVTMTGWRIASAYNKQPHLVRVGLFVVG